MTAQAGEQRSCCGKKASAKTNGKPPSPRDHAPDSCPCRHNSTMTGAEAAKADVFRHAVGPTFFTDCIAFPASILPEPYDMTSGTKQQFLIGPPASLAGRELLRAYRILRC
jgi:hypothetical protein